jgi:hypothetical protein
LLAKRARAIIGGSAPRLNFGSAGIRRCLGDGGNPLDPRWLNGICEKYGYNDFGLAR